MLYSALVVTFIWTCYGTLETIVLLLLLLFTRHTTSTTEAITLLAECSAQQFTIYDAFDKMTNATGQPA